MKIRKYVVLVTLCSLILLVSSGCVNSDTNNQNNMDNMDHNKMNMNDNMKE